MKAFQRLLTPYIVWISVFIVIPMLLITVYAFTTKGNSVTTLQFTLENFHKFFFDPIFLDVLWRSLRIALITTAFCILLGYPVAYIIANMEPKYGKIIILLITIPMWINMLVRTYSWIGILADNGLINNLLSYFGLPQLELIHNDFSVILGMVYNFIPFMILQIYTSLAKMDRSLIHAANDLGANKIQTFLRVTLPLSIPGVLSGITLVFLPSVSSFVIPKLLGGGGYVLIGNIIENQFITVGEWNFGAAVSLIMAIVIMISLYITKQLDKQDPSVTSGGVA